MKKYINTYSVAAIMLMCMWITYSMKNRDMTGLCQLDAMLLVMQPVCYGKLVIPAVWAYMYATRNDFAVARIIRMKDRRVIWRSECGCIITYAALCTLLIIATAWISGGVLFRNGGIINGTWYGTGVLTVIIKACALCYSQLLGSMLFTALARWICNTYIFPLIVVAAVAISDGNILNVPIYFLRFRYNMPMWLSDNMGAVQIIAKLLLIAAVIAVMGYMYAGRKEFISAENNIQ